MSIKPTQPSAPWQVCDFTHGGYVAACLHSVPMEWILQVVDEIDDAIAILRHGWLGVHAPIGKLAGGLAAAMPSAFAAGLKVRLFVQRARP